MQRFLRHQMSEWCGLFGALCLAPALAGCPGALAPELAAEASGGGPTGAGGAGTTGGTGGSGSACTGANDGATIVMSTCATADCHSTYNADISGGLDLTVDGTIGARLVGVTSYGTSTNGSACVDWPTPYLERGVTPAAGLLIDKITLPANSAGLCPDGLPMPYGQRQLPKVQQDCIQQWATGLVMAAGQ
ncbi:MAG TPA: hypothetical protein VHO06_23265 [Polyangia bacterium]|nr:hypothetical protein [Polyangia bacterium]